MQLKLLAFAATLLASLLGMTGHAAAQSRFEANMPGFFGGYSTFGGYYDTFGDFGGRHTYNGYVRSYSRNTSTVTLLSVPLQKRSTKSVSAKYRSAKHANASDCRWLQQNARDSGKRKWKLRYEACRAQA